MREFVICYCMDVLLLDLIVCAVGYNSIGSKQRVETNNNTVRQHVTTKVPTY